MDVSRQKFTTAVFLCNHFVLRIVMEQIWRSRRRSLAWCTADASSSFFFLFSCNIFRLRCQKLKLDCRPRGMLRLWNRRTIRYNCASQVSNVLLFLKKEKTFKIERVKDLQQKSLLHATKLYNFLYLSLWQFSVQTKGRFRIRLINSYPVITTFSSGSGKNSFTLSQSFGTDNLVTATYPPVLARDFSLFANEDVQQMS